MRTGFQWQKCLDFLGEMEERGIRKNVVIYGAAIAVMEKSRKADLALKLFNKMKNESINPNTLIYNTVILACANCSMKGKAHELFREMRKFNITPNEVSALFFSQSVCYLSIWIVS